MTSGRGLETAWPGPSGGAGSSENCPGYLGHEAREGQSPLLRV